MFDMRHKSPAWSLALSGWSPSLVSEVGLGERLLPGEGGLFPAEAMDKKDDERQ